MKIKSIGIIGGTGQLGRGFAKRWAQCGFDIIIGSRSTEKATLFVNNLKEGLGNIPGEITGGDNAFACKADVVVITIPVESIDSLIAPQRELLMDKIVFDTMVNLKFGKFIKTNLIDGMSTYEYLQTVLPESKIVSCFKTISADLLDGDEPIDQADFQISKYDEAIEISNKLSSLIGFSPVRVNGRTHAHTIERMVALAIQLNKTYPGSHVGYLLKNLQL